MALLRVSGELEGERYDLHAVTDAAAAGSSGIAHERELVALAEAVVGGDESALARAREDAIAALGPERFVGAAAVASNFERMVRMADATGIPLDPPVAALSAELGRELGIDRFGSAANTPRLSTGAKWLGRGVAPLARYLLPALARLAGRTAPRR